MAQPQTFAGGKVLMRVLVFETPRRVSEPQTVIGVENFARLQTVARESGQTLHVLLEREAVGLEDSNPTPAEQDAIDAALGELRVE